MLPTVRARPTPAATSTSGANEPTPKTEKPAPRSAVDSFAAVTAEEKQALLASVRAAKAGAAPMAARQASLALETLQNIELMTKTGTLTPKSEAALASLRAGRAPDVASPHDPFAGKKGWAMSFEGVRSRDFTFAGLTVHAVALDLAEPRLRPKSESSFVGQPASHPHPAVLSYGKALAPTEPGANEKAARTGVGLSKSGRMAYLVAVEGQTGVRGLTSTGLGKLLRSLGAEDAQALETGKQLLARGRDLVPTRTSTRSPVNAMTVQVG